MNSVEEKIEQLPDKLTPTKIFDRLRAYIKRLLFPIYLFPLKLVIYTLYYLVIFLAKLVWAFLGIIFDIIIYPFLSLKNFIKSLFVICFLIYIAASIFVIADYLISQYGYYDKFLCSVGVRDKLKESVVRVVGTYSEGTGFFVTPDHVLTSFHVIADESSPKIIFPNGEFITPIKILGNKDADLALLVVDGNYSDFVMPMMRSSGLRDEEPLIAAGYPLGTDLIGDATLLKGRFNDFKKYSDDFVDYIQTDIDLVGGMSGGPLVDLCGDVVGVNTMSFGDLSLFINISSDDLDISQFTDQDIAKIEIDASKSPESAVEAFYTYLKARRMEDGFSLLSDEYLKKTSFDEWTSRFYNVLDVDVISAKAEENTKGAVYVKFSTKNWDEGKVNYHYYEGTWQTVLEDGVYKMYQSNIEEVFDPPWDWFYDFDE